MLHPINFTSFSLANAVEILGTDGTPKFTITPFGQILTPAINVNTATIFELQNNNIELIGTNATIFNL